MQMLTRMREVASVKMDARVPLGVGGSKEHALRAPIAARAHLSPKAGIQVVRAQSRSPALPGAHCARNPTQLSALVTRLMGETRTDQSMEPASHQGFAPEANANSTAFSQVSMQHCSVLTQ